MATLTINEIIKELRNKQQIAVRECGFLSWGDKEKCKELFIEIFKQIDHTFYKFEYLPEYDEIVDWMTGTGDKGLMLMGDCGRGKSIILTGVIPVLMRMFNTSVKPVLAQDLGKLIYNDPLFNNVPPGMTYLDYFTQYAKNIIIDEVGTETMRNDYGEKVEAFNTIINSAEHYHKRLFISTNLTEEQILDRYGVRTVDRLSHLCRIVKFQGDSLR